MTTEMNRAESIDEAAAVIRQNMLEMRREQHEGLKEERKDIIEHWVEQSVKRLELEDIDPEDMESPIQVLFPDVSTGIGGKAARQWMSLFQEKMNGDFLDYSEDEFQVPVKSFGTGVSSTDRRYLNSALAKPLSVCMVEEEHFCFGVIAPAPSISSLFNRGEDQMLASATRHIRNDGTLIFITPRSTLPENSTLLAMYYQNLQFFALPDRDYTDENNLVLVMGTKSVRKFYDLNQRVEEITEFARDTSLTELQTGYASATDFVRPVGEGPEKLPTFRSYLIDRNLAITEAESTDILQGTVWDSVVGLDNTDDGFMPQNPLTMGHIGWIVSSGSTSERGLYLEKIDDDGQPLERQLFRGTAKKKEDVSHNYAESTETRLEKLDARTVSLNMDSWQWDTSVELSPFIQKWRAELAGHMAEYLSPHFSPEKFGQMEHRYQELLRQPLSGIGQRLSIESIVDAFSHESRVIMNGEPGLGKTYIACAVVHMLAKKVVAVECPIGIVWKWYREIVDTIPGAQAFVIGKKPPKGVPNITDYKHPTVQLEQIRRIADPEKPTFIILPSSSSKLDFYHLPAAVWRFASKKQMPDYETDDEGSYPVGSTRIEAHRYAGDEEDLLGLRPQKVACCPECLQPIVNAKGQPQTWTWLAKGRRSCDNLVRSEDYTSLVRAKTLSRFDFGRSYGDGDLVVTEAQIRRLIPMLNHEDVKITEVGVFTNHVTVQYEIRKYKPEVCGAPLWQAKSRQIEVRERSARKMLMAEYDADFSREYARDQKLSDLERPVAHLVEDIVIENELAMHLTPRKQGGYGTAGLSAPGILRLPLCQYIAKHMPGWVEFLIADELHTYSGEDSAQGESAGRLANIVPLSLGLTGTLMNGKSSNLFYTLWRFSSRIRKHYGYHEKARWIKDHGFYKKEIAYRYSDQPQRGRNRTHEPQRVVDKWNRDEVPGIMPTALPMLLPNSIFMRLEDVVEGLPPFTEYNIPVDLDDRENGNEEGMSQRQAYKHLQVSLKQAIKTMMARNASEGAKMMATYLQALLSYPDGCTNPNASVVTNLQDEEIFRMQTMREDWVYPKEQKLLDLIAEETAQGRRVLVYATHTRTRDITARVRDMLEDAGHNAHILRSNTVDADKRIDWIEDRLHEGMEVLITHPGNVEMGHDLRWFPTIIWLEPDYQANRVRQASRRSWRIGQTEPVKVYYLTYNQTMQTRALQLVAQKIATSLAVEGELPTDGLAALSPSTSIEMELARTLVQDASLIEEDRTFTGLIQIAVQKNAQNGELLIEGGQDAYRTALGTGDIPGIVKIAASSGKDDAAVKDLLPQPAEPVQGMLIPVFDTDTNDTVVQVVEVKQSVSNWLEAFQMSEAELANNGKTRRRRR